MHRRIIAGTSGVPIPDCRQLSRVPVETGSVETRWERGACAASGRHSPHRHRPAGPGAPPRPSGPVAPLPGGTAPIGASKCHRGALGFPQFQPFGLRQSCASTPFAIAGPGHADIQVSDRHPAWSWRELLECPLCRTGYPPGRTGQATGRCHCHSARCAIQPPTEWQQGSHR